MVKWCLTRVDGLFELQIGSSNWSHFVRVFNSPYSNQRNHQLSNQDLTSFLLLMIMWQRSWATRIFVHIQSLGCTVTSQGRNGGYLVTHHQEDVNCFSELIDRLSNLYFTFADPDNPQLPHLIFRILGPRDYFVASNSDRRRCYLHIGPRGTNGSLRLSGRLVDRIAGIQFDYQNNQICLY